jgi:glycosyltransferase involved in cell wall biosynthesis
MEVYVLHHADYAIAGSVEAESVLRVKGYRGSARVIPQFGVDPDHFMPPSDGHRDTALDSSFRIGYVGGRLVEEKGVDVLLRAVAKLNGDWELRVLGSGPAKSQLQALARELGIAARVHFDAPRPSVEMPTYFGQLDTLVLPSRTRPNWKEQFGRVLIEAMACEVAVIGSTCGEIPNVIGDAGLVFPEGDADALGVHLAALRDNPAVRAELGKRGRTRVLAQFTQARVAEETYAIYRQVLSMETR